MPMQLLAHIWAAQAPFEVYDPEQIEKLLVLGETGFVQAEIPPMLWRRGVAAGTPCSGPSSSAPRMTAVDARGQARIVGFYRCDECVDALDRRQAPPTEARRELMGGKIGEFVRKCGGCVHQ